MLRRCWFIGLLVSLLMRETLPEKSLFDEVPFNGASVSSEVEFSSKSLTGKDSRESQSQSQESKEKSESAIITSGEKRKQTPTYGGSLFDSVPNQGAITDSRDKARNTRDSIDFEMTRIAPKEEYDIPYWDKGFIAPIVNSIVGTSHSHSSSSSSSSSSSPPSTTIRPPSSRFSFLSALSTLNPFSNRPTYPPPYKRRLTSYNGHGGWHTSDQYNEDEYFQRKPYNVTASSGGPTVIVYTHSKKESESTKRRTTTQPPVKNEVHYHYHINGESSKHPPKPPPYNRKAPSHSHGYGSSYSKSKAHHSHPPRVMVQPNTYTNTREKEKLQMLEDDFSRRTFVRPSKIPYDTYRPDLVSITKEPSTSFQPPPPPNSKYGPPPPQYGVPDLSTSYGPPPASPPAPPPQQFNEPLGNDQYETTITLQTIPITRQVTELVQVPNVVHKISSNRPTQQEQQQQAEEPSPIYGPPAPPPQKQRLPISATGTGGSSTTKMEQRPFESHISQILGVPTTPRTPLRESIIQELLVNQARFPGFDLTLSDLELLSLLQASKGNSRDLLSSSLNPFQPIRSGSGGLLGSSSSSGLRVQSLGVLGGGNQGGGWNPSSSLNLGGIGGGGGGDGLSSLREAIREQRLQLALQDLRKQLRDQNKDSARERTNYKNLFTRGAMLLSALSIIPSMMNPGAAGNHAATIPNVMLPVTNVLGRRRRSLLESKQSHSSHPTSLECLRKSSSDEFDDFSLIVPCIQTQFCQIIRTASRINLVEAYDILFHEAGENPFVEETLDAARRGRCQ